MNIKIRFQHIFLPIFLFRVSNCYRFEPNTITLTNYSACPGNENNVCQFKQNIIGIARNKYAVSGELLFKEAIHPPIQLNYL